MNSYDYGEYDYRCSICGRGYFADVGLWGSPCCEQLRMYKAIKSIERKEQKNKASDNYDYSRELDDVDDRPW